MWPLKFQFTLNMYLYLQFEEFIEYKVQFFLE